VRRDGEDRIPAACPEASQIIEIFYLRNFFCGDIQHDHVRAEQTHLDCRNEKDAHGRGLGERFFSIKHSIVQSDREDAKAERTRLFQ
jgi:hypothetical protein